MKLVRKEINMYLDLTPELTNYGYDNFSIIGRALALATNFEKTFKIYLLALSTKYKTIFLKQITEFKKIKNHNDLSEFTNVVNKISFDKAIKIVTTLLPDTPEVNQIQEQLLKAKNARNYIAHDLCIGYYNNIEKADYREILLEEIKEKLMLIIQCTLGLEIAISIFNQEPIYIGIEKRSKEILEWATEICE
jgi:hypothetical protein